MLRVGLTGGLGSGKSTAAKQFAYLGAHVLYADEIARGLMQPGEAVYEQIVGRFGSEVLADGGQLDRAALARIAFGTGRVEELNAIVHPATIGRQAELMAEIAARDQDAVVMVESALVFETRCAGEEGWHKRFDRIILVRAPEPTKIARFVARMSGGAALDDGARAEIEADARRRMAQQLDDNWKAERSDYVLTNDGPVEKLIAQVDALWPTLQGEAHKGR
ncbi:MAG TPA: dephospho-CoA kinase [Acidobacteriaceae bacterium]|jgi:dephospho-CoA kinase|nr:dephospho-CoA kinase [Acidobacteriaceae bacterium]